MNDGYVYCWRDFGVWWIKYKLGPVELPWVDHRPIFVLFQYLQYKVMEEDIHLTCLDVTMQFYFDVHNYSSDG